MLDRPVAALCRSMIPSESLIRLRFTIEATLDVVLPLEWPGKARFRSLPSGKYLDFERYHGRFRTGTILTVPAIVLGSNAPSGPVNMEERRFVHALGPVNSFPWVPPIIVTTGPGLTP